jgi:hypothetical protein
VLKGDQREVLNSPFKSVVNENNLYSIAILKGDQREFKGDQRKFLRAPFKSLVNQYFIY